MKYTGEGPHLTPGPGLLGAWQLAASFLLPAAEAGRGALLHGPACGVRGSGDCCALEAGGIRGWPATVGLVRTSSNVIDTSLQTMSLQELIEIYIVAYGAGAQKLMKACRGIGGSCALEAGGMWGWPATWRCVNDPRPGA